MGHHLFRKSHLHPLSGIVGFVHYFSLLLIVIIAALLIGKVYKDEKDAGNRALVNLKALIEFNAREVENYRSQIIRQKKKTPDTEDVILRLIDNPSGDGEPDLDTQVRLKANDDNTTFTFDVLNDRNIISALRIVLLPRVRHTSHELIQYNHTCTIIFFNNGSGFTEKDNGTCEINTKKNTETGAGNPPLKKESPIILMPDLDESPSKSRSVFSVTATSNTEAAKIVGASLAITYYRGNLQKDIRSPNQFIDQQYIDQIEAPFFQHELKLSWITSADAYLLNDKETGIYEDMTRLLGGNSREYYIAIFKCHETDLDKDNNDIVVCKKNNSEGKNLLFSTYIVNPIRKADQRLLDRFARENVGEEYLIQGIPDLEGYSIAIETYNQSIKWYYLIITAVSILVLLSWHLLAKKLRRSISENEEYHRKLVKNESALKSNEESLRQSLEKEKIAVETLEINEESLRRALGRERSAVAAHKNLKQKVIHDVGRNLTELSAYIRRVLPDPKKLGDENRIIPADAIREMYENADRADYAVEVLRAHGVDSILKRVEAKRQRAIDEDHPTKLHKTVKRCIHQEKEKKLAPIQEDSSIYDPSVSIFGNKQHFRAAYSNLLKNATYAEHLVQEEARINPDMESKVHVAVSAHRSEDDVIFTIWNRVSDATDLDNIEQWFEPGYSRSPHTTDSSTQNSEVHGKGMGLPHAREIVRGLGGELSCQKMEKNGHRGVEFTMILPLYVPREEETEVEKKT